MTNLPPKAVALFTTTLAQSIGTGDNETITLNTAARLPQGEQVTLTIDRLDSNGNPTLDLRECIQGTVSGNNIVDYLRGYDETQPQAHQSGAVVEVVLTAADWNKLIDAANPKNMISDDEGNSLTQGLDGKLFTVGGALIVPDEYFFDSIESRDSYFTENPTELVPGELCVVDMGDGDFVLQEYKSAGWTDVTAAIRGPKGNPGNVGPEGPAGHDGTGLVILDWFDTLTSLQTAHPTGNEGDLYSVGTATPYILYLWSVSSNSWVPNGTINFDPSQYVKTQSSNSTNATSITNPVTGPVATAQSSVTSAKVQLVTNMPDTGEDFTDNGAGAAPSGAYVGMTLTSADGQTTARVALTPTGLQQQLPGKKFEPVGMGGSNVAPGDVSNLAISPIGRGLVISWTDPDDEVTADGITKVWQGTKVVRKEGSFPTSITDGEVVCDSRERNKYQDEGYQDLNLSPDSTFFYQLFPYSPTGAFNGNVTNQISGTPNSYKVWGVRIDENNNNPSTALTYTDDAVGMTAGSSSWDLESLFANIKPCLLKDGAVQYYLDPSDFTKKADGTTADIASGTDGDVMIEIPKLGLSINRTGQYLDVKVTDDPSATGSHYYAHTRASEGDRDKLYWGAYKGTVVSGKLRSLSGKSITATQNMATFRNQAQANGSGYDMTSFYPMTLLQALFIVKYKNLNSQQALGMGYVGGSTAQNTGATNVNGMFYGSSSNVSRVKFAGIEDFWGNIWEWIEGCITDANRNILTAYRNFNDSASGYMNQGQGASTNISGWQSKSQGTSEKGFLAQTTSGSDSTYYADSAALYASAAALFGATWANGAGAGAFYVNVANAPSAAHATIAARLMYL